MLSPLLLLPSLYTDAPSPISLFFLLFSLPTPSLPPAHCLCAGSHGEHHPRGTTRSRDCPCESEMSDAPRYPRGLTDLYTRTGYPCSQKHQARRDSSRCFSTPPLLSSTSPDQHRILDALVRFQSDIILQQAGLPLRGAIAKKTKAQLRAVSQESNGQLAAIVFPDRVQC